MRRPCAVSTPLANSRSRGSAITVGTPDAAASLHLYQATYETHADTSVRRAAWASFCAGLVPYQHTMGAAFATEIAKNVVIAKARGYQSTERYLLHDHQVPFDLYSNVLDTNLTTRRRFNK